MSDDGKPIDPDKEAVFALLQEFGNKHGPRETLHLFSDSLAAFLMIYAPPEVHAKAVDSVAARTRHILERLQDAGDGGETLQ